jgi:hypothetical protein
MTEVNKALLKIKAVAMEVSYLQCDALNKDQKFKYVKASKVMAACRASMLMHNLIMTTTMLSHEAGKYTSARGGNLFMATVKIEVTFHDLDSGESISFSYYGTGMDVSDKAVGKATTYAVKYALLKTFLIETGEDDPDNETLESISDKQLESVVIDKYGLNDKLKAAAEEGIDHLKEVWETEFSANEKKLMMSQLIKHIEEATKESNRPMTQEERDIVEMERNAMTPPELRK